MIGMTVDLNGDGSWPDLAEKIAAGKVHHIANNAPPIRVAVLDAGLSSGRPSVTLRIDMADGTTVVAETTARLFCTTARMIMAKYPNLFED